MKKICYVATIPAVVHSFLRDHVRAASENYDVTIICNHVDAYLLNDMQARIILLSIERKIYPWRDLLALIDLISIFRRERFDLVHSIMPKTGLLSMLAAFIARVPNRAHIFTGQVWATRQGWVRKFLKMFDKLIVLLATHVLADSPSQRDFLIAEKVVSNNQCVVIADGSICGVDTVKFKPDDYQREKLRKDLNVLPEDTLILFLGRLNRDKGVIDLAKAFTKILLVYPNAILLFVGSEEDVTFLQIQGICGIHNDRLRRVSFTTYPEHYMTATDIFCLPSYREGFGQVIVEAAACGVPSIASRIYGVTDSVSDGETGLLFKAGDIDELTKVLLKLIEDSALRHELGEAARIRVLEKFQSQKITDGMMLFYKQILF